MFPVCVVPLHSPVRKQHWSLPFGQIPATHRCGPVVGCVTFRYGPVVGCEFQVQHSDMARVSDARDSMAHMHRNRLDDLLQMAEDEDDKRVKNPSDAEQRDMDRLRQQHDSFETRSQQLDKMADDLVNELDEGHENYDKGERFAAEMFDAGSDEVEQAQANGRRLEKQSAALGERADGMEWGMGGDVDAAQELAAEMIEAGIDEIEAELDGEAAQERAAAKQEHQEGAFTVRQEKAEASQQEGALSVRQEKAVAKELVSLWDRADELLAELQNSKGREAELADDLLKRGQEMLNRRSYSREAARENIRTTGGSGRDAFAEEDLKNNLAPPGGKTQLVNAADRAGIKLFRFSRDKDFFANLFEDDDQLNGSRGAGGPTSPYGGSRSRGRSRSPGGSYLPPVDLSDSPASNRLPRKASPPRMLDPDDGAEMSWRLDRKASFADQLRRLLDLSGTGVGGGGEVGRFSMRGEEERHIRPGVADHEVRLSAAAAEFPEEEDVRESAWKVSRGGPRGSERERRDDFYGTIFEAHSPDDIVPQRARHLRNAQDRDSRGAPRTRGRFSSHLPRTMFDTAHSPLMLKARASIRNQGDFGVAKVTSTAERLSRTFSANLSPLTKRLELSAKEGYANDLRERRGAPGERRGEWEEGRGSAEPARGAPPVSPMMHTVSAFLPRAVLPREMFGPFSTGGGPAPHHRDWRILPAFKLSNISRGKTT